MKANELMIGDLVQCTYWHNPHILQVYELKRLGNDELKIVVVEDATPLVFQEVYIEPIPLTAEILEKNGFVRREDLVESIQDSLPFIWENEKTESVVVAWRDSYDNGLRDENAEVLGEYWQINVDGIEARCEKTAKHIYVHELQHALRLCGIDKEIVL